MDTTGVKDAKNQFDCAVGRGRLSNTILEHKAQKKHKKSKKEKKKKDKKERRRKSTSDEQARPQGHRLSAQELAARYGAKDLSVEGTAKDSGVDSFPGSLYRVKDSDVGLVVNQKHLYFPGNESGYSSASSGNNYSSSKNMPKRHRFDSESDAESGNGANQDRTLVKDTKHAQETNAQRSNSPSTSGNLSEHCKSKLKMDSTRSSRIMERDLSPPRRRSARRNDSDSSLTSSSTHTGMQNARESGSSEGKHQSPVVRRDTYPDLSPPRRRPRTRSNSSMSSISSSGAVGISQREHERLRRGRLDSDSSDSSSPVENEKSNISHDLSPPRRRTRIDSEASEISDLSNDSHYLSRGFKINSGEAKSNPATTFRDEHGRVIDIEACLKEKERALKQTSHAKARLNEGWRIGAADKAMEAQALVKLQEARETPFAVYENDQRLNESIRHIARAEDPMAKFANPTSQLNNAQHEISQKKYQGPPAPPNRFNIAPGYRWDGVDRSNGFEPKVLQRIRM